MEEEVVGGGEKGRRRVYVCPEGPEGFDLRFGVRCEGRKGVIVIGETHRTES